MFHERQSLQLCAVHVLNNLLQSKVFTKADLDEICAELAPDAPTWWNPHKSSLGLGNYDVNVIMFALHKHGYETIWFDRRRDIFETLDPESAFGFILNLPSNWALTRMLPSSLQMKHWIAIKKIGCVYFNLDSKLSEPQPIGEGIDLLKYLSGELKDETGSELIIVKALRISNLQAM